MAKPPAINRWWERTTHQAGIMHVGARQMPFAMPGTGGGFGRGQMPQMPQIPYPQPMAKPYLVWVWVWVWVGVGVEGVKGWVETRSGAARVLLLDKLVTQFRPGGAETKKTL